MYWLFFFLTFVFIPSAYYWKIKLFKSLVGSAIGLLGIYIAILAFSKVYGLADAWLTYSIADRSMAWETRLDEARRRISPVFINQGGDAIAYENLVKKFLQLKDKDEAYNSIKQQLNKIYDNIESTDNPQFFKYTLINLDKGFDVNNDLGWLKIDGTKYQTNEIFLPKSIVGQLGHGIFWMTRAQCARFLREEKSFKEFVTNNSKREKLLADFKPENMFKKLIDVIENDYSLVVRKEALNTYLFWACKTDECKATLIDDGIYYFDKVSKHWSDNEPEILSYFKTRIGLVE